MYSGEDGLLPELANIGAIGLISVISNIWPKQVKSYISDSVNKTIEKHTDDLWKKATAACFEVANPIPVKVWLAYKNIIETSTLRAPLISKELDNVNNLEKVHELINTHYHSV